MVSHSQSSKRRDYAAFAVKLTGSGVLALAGLIAALIAFFYLWKNKAGIVAAVNPLSDKNLAYQGAGQIVSAATGGAETTVGGLAARFREWVSGDTAAIEAMKIGTPQERIKPTSPNCVWCELGAGGGFDPNPLPVFNPYAINPRDRT